MITREEVNNSGERSVQLEQEGWEYSHQGMIYLQHLFAYNAILSSCRSATVLDVGCGSGYGSRLLGTVAKSVIGLDVDNSAIKWASIHDDQPNVQYLCDTIHSQKLSHTKYDVIVAFQVIEHISPDHLSDFLNQAAGLLAPQGVLFLTTPNRLRRLHYFQAPWNAYHFTEYSPWSLRKTLEKHFQSVTIRYLSANSHVLGAEWERGTNITPFRYFVSGPIAYATGKFFQKLFFFSESYAHRAPFFVNRIEKNIFARVVHPHNAQWNKAISFSVDDFYITPKFSWWAIDLFSEVRNPRPSSFK